MNWGADPDEPREGTPERVVATWTDTVLQRDGQPAQRGFGGRIYFYDRGPDPIAVKGRLVVYAFDETGRSPVDHQPTRRYVFPTEQLPLHASTSDLGPSYSVWLPWDGADGPSTEVSLVARFEPLEGGGLVVSEQARQRLPGRIGTLGPGVNEPMLADRPNADSVRVASYTPAATASAEPQTGSTAPREPRNRTLSTTTINLKR
jgi:hypothetical protein